MYIQSSTSILFTALALCAFTALAVGCGSEGAVHSHTRRAIAEGLERTALHQVALLGIGPLGLPSAIAAMTWIDDVIASPT